MKNVMNNLGNNIKNYSVYLGIFFLALGTSCSDDDDGDIIPPETPRGSITANDQTISQDTLIVDNVQADTDAWLVVRRTDESGASMAQPVFIEENTNSGFSVQLNSGWDNEVTTEGETVVLLLYRDDGDGAYDANDDTVLLTTSSGTNVSESIVITPSAEPNAFRVSNQTLSQNTLILENVTVTQDSWVIVRNSGEDVMVSDPVFVAEGTTDNVAIALSDKAKFTGDADGDDFDISLHADNPDEGVQGEFDADFDAPITNEAGDEIRGGVNITAPRLDADDNQTVTDNNEVTFNSVNAATDGWVILYGEDDQGNIDENTIIGTGFVEAGLNENFTVAFNEGFTHTSGQTIFPRLFMDDPADQEFTFTQGGTEDLPEIYGYNTTTGEGQFVGNSSTTTGGFTVN